MSLTSENSRSTNSALPALDLLSITTTRTCKPPVSRVTELRQARSIVPEFQFTITTMTKRLLGAIIGPPDALSVCKARISIALLCGWQQRGDFRCDEVNCPGVKLVVNREGHHVIFQETSLLEPAAVKERTMVTRPPCNC